MKGNTLRADFEFLFELNLSRRLLRRLTDNFPTVCCKEFMTKARSECLTSSSMLGRPPEELFATKLKVLTSIQ